MRGDPRPFLLDIVEAADAILEALAGLTLEQDRASRLIRSSVEGELIIIGEAHNSLALLNKELFNR
jgi:uncharacterized protein with HEPN domain